MFDWDGSYDNEWKYVNWPPEGAPRYSFKICDAGVLIASFVKDDDLSNPDFIEGLHYARERQSELFNPDVQLSEDRHPWKFILEDHCHHDMPGATLTVTESWVGVIPKDEQRVRRMVDLSWHEEQITELQKAYLAGAQRKEHETSHRIHNAEKEIRAKTEQELDSKIETYQALLVQYESERQRRQQEKKEFEAREIIRTPDDGTGFVYLIQSVTGHYKIGKTKDPNKRIQTFNVKLPMEVEYLHLIPCENRHEAERTLHARYANKRVNGEWFNLSPDDITAIKSIERL